MAAKLKVFRTTIGFHDAYVAVASRAAALRAWGASTDLFAMGAAEQVTDEALMKPALARPGEVIRQSRGSEAEHIEATKPNGGRRGSPAPATKPLPKPSRTKLERAEKRLSEAEAQYMAEREQLEAEITKLRDRLDAVRRAHEAERSRMERARDTLAQAYDEELSRWRES